jgi:nucleoside-diphosphate-sugar epimerase
VHILVVGGTRFVGYLTVQRLLAARHRVTLFNRGTREDPFGTRVERLTGDRTTPEFERALSGRRFDAAVDFAAYTGSDVERAIATLDVGHYLFISTGQVYLIREDAPRPSREEDYDGTLLPRPSDPADLAQWEYGMGKRDGEDALVRASARFPSTRLRLPIVHGERDHDRRIESYLVRILDGAPIVVPDGGQQPMRHVYGMDVAAALVAMVCEHRTFGEAFNLAQDETPTLVELLHMLAALVGAHPRLCSVSSEAIRAAGLDPREISPLSTRWASFVDPTKAKRELGFRHTPLREYLGRIVASYLAHPPASPPESYSTRSIEAALV